jgi:intracellular sulfur oxidation DsrE/DsrF family protein
MIEKGVSFVVCRNTMKQRNISEVQIIPNMGFVPMGVGEIILKQEQGWSYLKAGF